MADNRSIFEQMSGTLGSQYSQTLGILSRNNKKKDKKAKQKALIGSILFSSLSEGSKYLKNNITNQIADLQQKATWDENYTKELWRQGSEIRAEEAAFSKNPAYFYKMATDNITQSPYGVDIARAGGIQNLSPTALTAYKNLVSAREAEYIANHKERMANPTASFATFKEFSQGDRDMLTLQANNLRDDLGNRNLFFAGLKKLGFGKDKEIEFNAELQTMRKEQEARYAAAEAYIAPLDVTKFIEYDTDGQALFTLGSALDLRNSDKEKTRLRKEMADSKNAIWNNITFSGGIYDINNTPLDKLRDSGTKTFGGTPLKTSELANMELKIRAGEDQNGSVIFKKDTSIQGAVPYLINDLYTLERRTHALQTTEVKNGTRETVDNLEMRYALAAQQLVNDGNIRIDRTNFNNYVYIPLNTNMSATDIVNSKNPNSNSNKLDVLATVHNQTEIANGQDFEEVYSKYLADRTDAADISGNIEELEFLESIKGVQSKASEEARLMFMIKPPKELAGKMLTFGNGNGVRVGSPNENYNYYYELFKNNADTNYGPSEAIEKLLNSRESKDSETFVNASQEVLNNFTSSQLKTYNSTNKNLQEIKIDLQDTENLSKQDILLLNVKKDRLENTLQTLIDGPVITFAGLTLEEKERKEVEQDLRVIKNQLKNSDRFTPKEIVELNEKQKELENILNIK